MAQNPYNAIINLGHANGELVVPVCFYELKVEQISLIFSSSSTCSTCCF